MRYSILVRVSVDISIQHLICRASGDPVSLRTGTTTGAWRPYPLESKRRLFCVRFYHFIDIYLECHGVELGACGDMCSIRAS